MKRSAKFLIVLALMSVVSVPVFSASAKVTYVKGKVEVNRNNTWVPLNVGDEVSESEMLSTGFQSEARLNYNGSVMALAALTRVTLSQLTTSGKKDYVDIYVDTGAVRSKVTHVDRDPPDYKTRTAVAVASVRGTDYVMFGNGTVSVNEGAVAVSRNVEGKKKYNSAAIEEQESEEVSAESGESEKEVGPASATTAANEIDSNAAAGTIVVAASQSTSFSATGNSPSNPFDEAVKKAKSGSDTVKSAAEGEAQKTVPVEKTGSLTITISFEE